MVYRTLGVGLPKSVKEKLTKEGANLTDFFPKRSNMKAGPPFFTSTLGLLENTVPATDEELRVEKPAVIKAPSPSYFDLEAAI